VASWGTTGWQFLKSLFLLEILRHTHTRTRARTLCVCVCIYIYDKCTFNPLPISTAPNLFSAFVPALSYTRSAARRLQTKFHTHTCKLLHTSTVTVFWVAETLSPAATTDVSEQHTVCIVHTSYPPRFPSPDPPNYLEAPHFSVLSILL
jgi:hypothetical protein